MMSSEHAPFRDLACGLLLQAAQDARLGGEQGREALAWLRTTGAAFAEFYLGFPPGVVRSWRPASACRQGYHAHGSRRGGADRRAA